MIGLAAAQPAPLSSAKASAPGKLLRNRSPPSLMPRYCIRSDNFQAISYFLDYPYTLGTLRPPSLPLFRLSLCSSVDLLPRVHGQRIFSYFPRATIHGGCRRGISRRATVIEGEACQEYGGFLETYLACSVKCSPSLAEGFIYNAKFPRSLKKPPCPWAISSALSPASRGIGGHRSRDLKWNRERLRRPVNEQATNGRTPESP